MKNKIKLGIVGFGNLGKGAVEAIHATDDLELVAVFTRRNPADLKLDLPNVETLHVDEAKNYQDKIDVLLLCGGSATDLPEQTPHFSQYFNTVDSYDNHAEIPEYYQAIDDVAQKSKTTSIISVGWDPGLFSLNRVMADAILPNGENYTFWGKGRSEEHTSELQSRGHLVCRLLLEKKNEKKTSNHESYCSGISYLRSSCRF